MEISEKLFLHAPDSQAGQLNYHLIIRVHAAAIVYNNRKYLHRNYTSTNLKFQYSPQDKFVSAV